MQGPGLSERDLAFYRENGYLMIEDAVSPEDLAELQAVARDFIDRSRRVAESNDIYDLDEGHSPSNPRLTRIKLPHKQHPVFDRVLRSDRMKSYFTALLGPDVVLQTSKLNTKAPGGGAAVEWHQDWAFYPHTNDDLAAVGVMMDDCAIENGPLLCVPGSHKAAFAPPADLSLQHPSVVEVPLGVGDVVIFTEALMHGTLPWRGTNQRRTLLYKYSPGSSSWSADHEPPAGPVLDGLSPRQRLLFQKPAVHGHQPVR